MLKKTSNCCKNNGHVKVPTGRHIWNWLRTPQYCCKQAFPEPLKQLLMKPGLMTWNIFFASSDKPSVLAIDITFIILDGSGS